ncbi:D-alanyl-D-alanine carboxypeptidase/D-alanyl-D-alanine-endopeptidase (penicillin-binding protein 4) [Shimia abyssi]|uniref:D-alanyl-D-alanine carboxypeptidase/D-alanyl-D-alanine-endopeptidase (Penicillin-binding protein 4) n=1 Tax=Shimia abyssi TaxID=1662395 RepID=A0A2P8F8V2_9RHOB|nr:D-alanyl-D-alanine carboxypeptidase/D-alanyl-D-alanine-endopeptidase (penicillin-binding protein 4) [Shimia abyssi]
MAGLLASTALPALANPPSVSLRPVLRPKSIAVKAAPSIDSVLQEAGLSGRVSFAVANAATGEILEQHGGATGQPPASVTKALTALYALEYLGPSHSFQTQLIAVGNVSGGVLDGDLVLRGGGDPTLDTNGLADLARMLRDAGIREVKGRFTVWGGALPHVEQIDDKQPAPAGYNPSISGLSLNFNRVHFEWKKGANGYAVSMDARSNKYRPEVSVAKMKIANRNLPVYTYQQVNGTDRWTVARSALGQGGARWLPVRQPEKYAGEVFRGLARAFGIVLKEPKVTQSAPRGSVLASIKSPPLINILQGMLKYSTNITAEMVGMAASQARGVAISDLRSSAQGMNAWAAETLNMQSARLVDHSGLGEASRMRVDELVKVLSLSNRQAALKPIMKEIALRDRTGKVDKAHPLKVRAKTGTLHFVSALAGYVDAPGGAEMTFAILTADLDARKRLIGPDRERPKGARTWNRRSKTLQQSLLERWGSIYGS